MHSHLAMLWGAAVVASLCGAGEATPGRDGHVVLVERGSPKAQIVLPAAAQAMETLAAEEFNLYLAKASDVRLPIVREPAEGVSEVRIGVADPAGRKALGLDELCFGGFLIDCDGTRLILAGSEPEGTLNAVYAFLEDVVGVRWFMPKDIGENVPRHESIRVPVVRRRVEPRFVNRRNHGINSSVPGEGKVWKRRIRITSHAIDVPFNRYSHNLNRIVPPTVYGKTHPEYFPLRGGERYIPTGMQDHSWQPCTTNPEVIRLAVDAARASFRKHPRANCFSVGMNDGVGFCKCPTCVALDIPGLEFRGRPVVSDRYFTFVKAVADELLQSHPDKYVTCIAYSVVEPPPQRVTLPRNVGVIITQDVGAWHDPAYKRKDIELGRAWAGAAGAFGSYNYTSLGWMLPRVYPHLMAESIRLYDEIGAVAVTNEAWPSFWYAGPQMYLRAKLMWDPTLDVDAVLAEYYTGFFGPAAEPMAHFYGILERCMVKERAGRWFAGINSVPDQIALWDREDLVEVRETMRRAMEAAKRDQRSVERVALVARGFAWVEAVIEEYWQAGVVRDLADADGAAAALVGALRSLAEWSQRRAERWEDIRTEPLIAGNYLRIMRERASRLTSLNSHLSAAVSSGLVALLERSGPRGEAELRQLAGCFPSTTLGAELTGRLWVREHPEGRNLMVNAGFEQTAAVGTGAEGAGWVTTNTPPAWSKWALRPETYPGLTWEQEGGRGEPRCVRIVGARNACFIQVHGVEPGQQYLVSTWARPGRSESSKAGLFVQWKDSAGAWASSAPRRAISVQGGEPRWRQISLVFTVPAGVAQAVILLRAEEQEAGDETRFDDVRLVRIPADVGRAP